MRGVFWPIARSVYPFGDFSIGQKYFDNIVLRCFKKSCLWRWYSCYKSPGNEARIAHFKISSTFSFLPTNPSPVGRITWKWSPRTPGHSLENGCLLQTHSYIRGNGRKSEGCERIFLDKLQLERSLLLQFEDFARMLFYCNAAEKEIKALKLQNSTEPHHMAGI